MAQAEKEIETYGKAIDEIFGQSDEAAESTERLTDAQREQVRTLIELEDEIAFQMQTFDAAYAEAMKGLSSTLTGFKKIDDPLKSISATDTSAALQSQLDFLTKYQANMQALKAMAADLGIELDAGMVAQLSNGSEESAAIVAGMVEAGGDAIKEINDKYGQVSTGKENMATVLADMQTDFIDANDAMVEKLKDTVEELNQSEQAALAGQATIDAFNDALSDGSAYTAQIAAYIRSLMANLGGAPIAFGGGGTGMGVSQRMSHASGLDYVPFDEYPASLHKGERVLTALQARAMDAQQEMAYGYPSFGGGGAAAAYSPIDYDRLGAAVARGLSGVSVNIDGEKAGELLEEHISRAIVRG